MIFNNKWKKILPSLLLLSVLFSSYKNISTLDVFSQPPIPELSLDPQDKGVFITSKVYSLQETKPCFFQDLLKKGYIPIELTFQNHSSHAYILSMKSVNLEISSGERVAKDSSKGGTARKLGFNIAGLFFWPMIIPSTLDSIYSYKSHKNLKKEFRAKTLKEEGEVLAPYSTMTRVLYVQEKEFREDFTISLRDADSDQQIQVSVHLKSKN